ncbi:hypothetical protein DPSP01_013964 [Paraphaeosphaeria sporulosa]
MGFQMQNPVPHSFKLEDNAIKLEASPIQPPSSSVAQTLSRPLPPISAWYDDKIEQSSSFTLSSEPPFAVGPTGDLAPNQRAMTQWSANFQFAATVHNSARDSTCNSASLCSSARSTSAPENLVVRKSKAKAKTRAVRGVAKAADDLEPKPVELTQKEAKALREQDARFDQSVSHADLWQECKKTNPNFIREGVTRNGRRGLRQLKKNNIDHRIDRPNEINKEHLIDLSTICHRQFREIIIGEMNNHRFNGRHAEAQVLGQKLKLVGTHV